MTDPTAGHSAGTPLNAEFDPMGRADAENRRLASNDRRDPTAARSAGPARNVEQDPTRVARRDP
jgi:hypothetical protein